MAATAAQSALKAVRSPQPAVNTLSIIAPPTTTARGYRRRLSRRWRRHHDIRRVRSTPQADMNRQVSAAAAVITAPAAPSRYPAGTVIATGDYYGAGIGGGYAGNGRRHHDIRRYGHRHWRRSWRRGYRFGDGYELLRNVNGGEITISGGEVTATGSDYGAGIAAANTLPAVQSALKAVRSTPQAVSSEQALAAAGTRMRHSHRIRRFD